MFPAVRGPAARAGRCTVASAHKLTLDMTPSGLRVGVAFGGRSVEHDVSIITGLQALGVLEDRHAAVPIYKARRGRWITGEALRELSVYQQDGGDPRAEEVNFDLHNGRL